MVFHPSKYPTGKPWASIHDCVHRAGLSTGSSPGSAHSGAQDAQGKVLKGVGGIGGLGDQLSTGKEVGQTNMVGKTGAGATHVCWGPRSGMGIRWPTQRGGMELGKLSHPASADTSMQPGAQSAALRPSHASDSAARLCPPLPSLRER